MRKDIIKLVCMLDVYRYIVSFLEIYEIPVVSKEFLKGYIEKKWRRLNGIPLLVDISWHTGSVCHKYCVCKVATAMERIEYYYLRKYRIYNI